MEQILNKKLDEVLGQKEQLVANFNALCGAEQMLRDLLNELKKGDEENGADR